MWEPVFYLDTNILRDCMRNRRKVSKESIHLLGTIKDNNWPCITAAFTFMELYDIEKEDIFFNKKLRHGFDVNRIIQLRKNKDLTETELKEADDRVNEFFDEYKFIKFQALDEKDGWDLAKLISKKSNLTAPDSIHLAVAIGTHANILVTTDADFTKEGTRFLKDNNMYESIRISGPGLALDVKDELYNEVRLEATLSGKVIEGDNPKEYLFNISGLGPVSRNLLFKAGYTTVSSVASANPKKLHRETGMPLEASTKIIARAKKIR